MLTTTSRRVAIGNLLCAVLAGCLVSEVQAAPSAQATWSITSGGNGHTYRVVAGSLISWDSANAAAQADGGYLATITSAAENAFVFALIDDPAFWVQSANGHGPWIGGYQLTNSAEPAGGFTWVLQNCAATPEPFAYTNWEAGEPNNLTATASGTNYNQDRVAFFHTGTGRAATWSDEYNLISPNLNQWTSSYVEEFNGVASVLANAVVLTNGSFQFGFTNIPGLTFDVAMTTNLGSTNWTLLGAATETSRGQFQFTDMQTTNSLRRFYRVLSP